MRKLLLFLPLILLFFAISCTKENEVSSDFLPFVPPQTAIILKADNLPKFTADLKKNPFFNHNQELPLFEFLSDSYQPFTNLQISDHSLWLVSKIGRDKIATTLLTSSTPTLLDSIGYDEIDGYIYNGESIKEYKLNEKTVYGTRVKGVFAFGDSKLIIENIIRLSKEKIKHDEELSKIYSSASSKNPTAYINIPEFEKIYNQFTPNRSKNFLQGFSNWLALDLEVKNNKINISGVSLPYKNNVLGLFENNQPGKTEIASITPSSSDGFYTFTYDSFRDLADNISFYRKEDYPNSDTDFIETSAEVGLISMGNSTALAIRPIDLEERLHQLSDQGEFVKSHRSHEIHTYSKPGYFAEKLNPLIRIHDLNHYSSVGKFLVFANDPNILENIIANYENGTVLSESSTYQNISKKLNDKSSILLVGRTKNLFKNLSKSLGKSFEEIYEKTDVSGFNIGALQFIKHDHFTFVHGEIQAAEGTAEIASGVQIRSFKPGEEVAAGPWFLENWRTKNYDIILQGKSNTLYAYDEAGNLRWKKQLDGPIIGDIEPIDIYHNRRIQMAFVTPQTFYIIDREGSVVKPFNKTFKSTITQPLAVFDYNNNGTFRFIITQGKKLSMYDKNLDIVKGFELTSTASPVVQKPKHFRMGNKDYILIPEESGKLHILNPRGQTRIKVDRNIAFTNNAWHIYNDLFTSTTKKGELIQIDQQGGINTLNLRLDSENGMDATAKTLVTFSENTLAIKGKKNKLDYGLYTQPKIFYLNDKIYISITELQAHKVYLFDSNSKLFSGFPVYGNSVIDLKSFANKEVKLIVKGEEDSVLMYDVN